MSTDASGGDRESSGAEEGSTTPTGSRLRKGLWIGIPTAAVVLAGAYVGLAATQSGKIQRGTTVAGRHVGGMSMSEAKAEVAAAARLKAGTPVQLRVGGTTLTLDPAKAGLSMDTSGVLDGLSGFSLNPSTVWHRLVGDGPHRTLTPQVDRDAL